MQTESIVYVPAAALAGKVTIVVEETSVVEVAFQSVIFAVAVVEAIITDPRAHPGAVAVVRASQWVPAEVESVVVEL